MTTEGLYITTAFYGGLFGYPILQFLAIWFMRGKWRVLALLPLLPALAIFFTILQGAYGGSELWVWLVLFFSPAILAYLLILLVVHAVVKCKRRNEPPPVTSN